MQKLILIGEIHTKTCIKKKECIADYKRATELDTSYEYFLKKEENESETGTVEPGVIKENALEIKRDKVKVDDKVPTEDLGPDFGVHDEDRDFVVIDKESLKQKQIIEKNPILAIAIYTDTVQKDPSSKSAFLYRGLAHMHMRHYEKAITDFAKAVKNNPQAAEAYYNRALANEKLKEYDKALSDFVKASILEPDFAINNATDMIRKNPLDTGAYNKRGNVYMQLNKYDEAINDYSMAVSINQNEAFAYYNRGIAYQAKMIFPKQLLTGQKQRN